MTRPEFATVMAYISEGCGVKLTTNAAEVYYDLLGDLPLPVLMVAAKQSLLQNTYKVFPQVGELRRLAAAAMSGKDGNLTAGEAWGLACRAVRSFGISHQTEGLASLPSVVAYALRCYGWETLCDSTNPETARSQFVKIYEPIAAREQRTLALPASVQIAISAIGREQEAKGQLNGPARLAIANIGASK